MIMFTPIYFMGWIIQPFLDGTYYVYERRDTSVLPLIGPFRSAEEAHGFVLEHLNES